MAREFKEVIAQCRDLAKSYKTWSIVLGAGALYAAHKGGKYKGYADVTQAAADVKDRGEREDRYDSRYR